MLIYWISPQKLLYMMFGAKMLKYAGYLGIYTMAFLKTKTYTDFSHQPGNCKTKRAGILCGLPALLTLQAAVPVEKAENFHFSEST